MNTSSSIDRLTFQDGEDILVTHVDNSERRWLLGAEAFSRTRFLDGGIEFRLLDDNGIDLEELKTVEKTYQKPYVRALGDVAYYGALRLENGERLWNKMSVPLPETVEEFRDVALADLGANDFNFEVFEGDGSDGEFTLATIMASLKNKTFPIGADPGYFEHDMADHSVGMALIDQSCAQTISALAGHAEALTETDDPRAHYLATSIAGNLDYFSFFRIFKNDMTHQHIDPLLTDIVKFMSQREHGGRSDDIRAIISKHGYRFNQNMKVLRSPKTAAYYRNVLKALEEPWGGSL